MVGVNNVTGWAAMSRLNYVLQCLDSVGLVTGKVSEQSFIFRSTRNRSFWTKRDESFQAVTCTGTDNSKQTRENTPRTQKETTE